MNVIARKGNVMAAAVTRHETTAFGTERTQARARVGGLDLQAKRASAWLAMIVCVSCLRATVVCGGENEVERSAAKLVTPAAEQSIQRGLRWLAAGQHDDGGFGTGQMRGNAAVCALAGMAMMSGGSTPGRGPYGRHVDRCVDYLLAHSQSSGFIAGPDSSRGPMYGHGFATMFLAECHGMTARKELRERLVKAVRIIVQSQNEAGGWRYQPVPEDADISVTICQVMALRTAKNAAIAVPSETIDRAIRYIKNSQNSDGGFAYQLRPPRESLFPRSAAAVAALYGAGIYEGPEIDKGLGYLMGFLPSKDVARPEAYYYYGQYYAAQAVWQAGGDRWTRWYPAIRDQLMGRQRDDGSWTDTAGGDECATAMACIVLQMPNNVLPIFQR